LRYLENENRIFTIRGVQIMLDSHIAEMYGVENKRINEQVKRNSDRFPEKFMFQLTDAEWNSLRSQIATLESNQNLRSQFATSSLHGGRRYLPYVFTEQGVAMLSAVLRSETAVKVSIQIIDAFVEMRKQIIGNAGLFQRLDKLETHKIDTDQKFEQIFKALESKDLPPDKGIFFDGQVYDVSLGCFTQRFG
jgi:phage regulator Rha-like protein